MMALTIYNYGNYGITTCICIHKLGFLGLLYFSLQDTSRYLKQVYGYYPNNADITAPSVGILWLRPSELIEVKPWPIER